MPRRRRTRLDPVGRDPTKSEPFSHLKPHGPSIGEAWTRIGRAYPFLNVVAAAAALCLSLGFLVYALNFSEFSWAYKQRDPCARGEGPYLEDGLAASLACGFLGAIVVLLMSTRGRPWREVGRLDRVALAGAIATAATAAVSGVLLLTIPQCVIY